MVGQIYTGGDLAQIRREALEQCIRIAEEIAGELGEEAGEIYIARKIADRIRSLIPVR